MIRPVSTWPHAWQGRRSSTRAKDDHRGQRDRASNPRVDHGRLMAPEELNPKSGIVAAVDFSEASSRQSGQGGTEAMSRSGLTTEQIMTIADDLAGATSMAADSAIYVPGRDISRVMMGIDVGAAELLLGRELGVDAVIAHHPAGGAAQLNFPRVMKRQVDLMVEAGVPLEVAKRAIQPRLSALMIRAHSLNHDHAPSIARLLKVPFLNIHLPLDEAGRQIMDTAVQTHLATLNRPALVSDVIAGLMTIPEIQSAPTHVMVPVGRLDNPAGTVVIFHGAGTNGGFAVAEALFSHGVGTIVYIHVAPEDVERLRALHLPDANLVISGHIASDLIGINRFVDKLESVGVSVVRMSGL